MTFRGIGSYIFNKPTNFNFLKYTWAWVTVFVLLLVATIGSIAIKGFNYDVDFSGGLSLEIESDREDISANFLREKLEDFSPEVQEKLGKVKKEFSIKIGSKEQDESEQKKTLAAVREILGEGVEYRNISMVGPKVGPELIRSAILATIFALLAIAFYVGMRFEMPFAISGLAALSFDVITTFGVISYFEIPFNLTSIAAVLTIAGYSINDTVVSFDRLCENMRKYPNKSLTDLINQTINKVLGRTILTSGSTLFAVLAFFFFGGEVLYGFSAALLWGVVIGTFSSIYISLPMLKLFKLR